MASPELPVSGSPAAVLAFVQDQRAVAQRAEVDVLEGALLWAALHPEESVDGVSTGSTTGVSTGSTTVFGEVAVPLGGRRWWRSSRRWSSVPRSTSPPTPRGR